MKKVKFLFLDVDGVLNTPKSISRCGGNIGVDDDKLKLLKKIVDGTNAKIVLVSTWKEGWTNNKYYKPLQDIYASYLDERLAAFGLTILDKTPNKAEGMFLSRGEGILEYLRTSKCDGYVIIDDFQFDYDGCGLTDNLVSTLTERGLTSEAAQKAIEILNRGE